MKGMNRKFHSVGASILNIPADSATDITSVTTSTTLSGATNAQLPTALAVKTYVDTTSTGLSFKNVVVCATTTNGTLATAYANGQTVDGVTLATGDRILIKNQTDAKENGIYTVNATGAPTRATDFDSGSEVEGSVVSVMQGTTNADSAWICTGDSIVVGTNNIEFAIFGGIKAGNGLTATADVFSIDTTITADVSTAQTFTNKTLTTPTIASFANAGHTHADAAGGGQLTSPLVNEAVALTSTSTEINQLHGVTVGGTSSGDIATIDDSQTFTNKIYDDVDVTTLLDAQCNIQVGTSGSYYAPTTGDNVIQVYATDATATGYTDGVSSTIQATGGNTTGAVRAFKGTATAASGADLAELYALDAWAVQADGSNIGSNMYNVGVVEINETDIADTPTGYICGLMGIYSTPGADPSVTLTTPGFKSAIGGVVKDQANTSPHAAVMAFAEGDSGAGVAIPAAFKAVSVRSTAGDGFNYGLDLYDEAGHGTQCQTADIRLQGGATIDELTTGTVNVDGVVRYTGLMGAISAEDIYETVIVDANSGTLSGATDTIEVNIPTGAIIVGITMNNDVATSDTGGDDTYTAAFSGGNNTAINGGSAIAKAQNTKTKEFFDVNAASALCASETNITLTPNGGNFDGGDVRAVVVYMVMKDLADT